MKKILKYVFALPALLVFSGCVKDTTDAVPKSDGKTITLRLDMPNLQPGPRALDPAAGDENRIDDITILAFTEKGADLVYEYTAENIRQSASGNILTLTATVRSLQKPQVFAIIVNGAAELAAAGIIRPQETLDDIQKRLITTTGAGEWPAKNNGSSDFTAFPMYARTTPTVVTTGTGNIGSFPLIRAVAKVNVTLDPSVGNFNLAQAMLFNYTTAGYTTYENSALSGNKVTLAAVPAIGNHGGDPIKEPTVLYEADYVNDTRGEIVNAIYTFESPAITSEADKTKGTALVVAGYYNGSQDLSYYRIDLKDDTEVSTNISSPLLRNHSYNVEIASVTGAGYGEAIDAYKGGSQLSARITAWNEAVQDISEGQYTLKVSNDVIYLDGEAFNDVSITAITDYDRPDKGFLPGIRIGSITYDTPGDDWLTVTGGQDGDISRDLVFTARQASAYGTSTAKVEVTAGNFTKIIKVIRITSVAAKFARSNIVMYVDDMGNKILTFAEVPADHTAAKIVYVDDGSGGKKPVSVPAIPSNVQGLHFRWGSLVGVTSDGTHQTPFVNTVGQSNSSVVFWPPEFPAPTGTWLYNNSTTSAAGQVQVPYVNSDEIGPVEGALFDAFDGYGTDGKGFIEAEGKGDICRYITERGWVDGKWRMPVLNELLLLYTETEPNSHNGAVIGGWMNLSYETISGTGADNKYGYFGMARIRVVGMGSTGNETYEEAVPSFDIARLVMPAAGGRATTTGNMTGTGFATYYWSSTPARSPYPNYAWSLNYYGPAGVEPGSGTYRTIGYSVRCIRDE